VAKEVSGMSGRCERGGLQCLKIPFFPVIVETPFKARKYATEHHAWKQQDLLKRKPLNLTVAMNEKKFSAVIQL